MKITPHTDIYTTDIDSSAKGTGHREAEKMAVSRLVAEHFGPGAVYAHHPDGAPYIEGCERCISVSHCRRRAVIAVSDKAVGVDIEDWREQLLKVRSKFLSTTEAQRFTTPEQILMAWTAKEATFKAARIEGATITSVSLPELRRAEIDGVGAFDITYAGDFPQIIAVAEPHRNC